VTLAYPIALVLLLILPIVWYIGRPRFAFRRLRDLSSLALRSLILILLVLSLAGLSIAQPTRKLAVVFLVDASDSVGVESLATQQALIEEAIATKGIEDEWAVIVFGADSAIDQQLTNRTTVQPILTTVNPEDTNIATALNNALGMFPSDATPRIVLLSDGQETVNNARQVAERVAVSNIPIFTIPIDRAVVSDTRITNIQVASRVSQEQPYDVTISIESQRPTPAQLLVFLNGTLVQDTNLILQAGENNYVLSQRSSETGFLNYTAQLVIPDDGLVQNNRLSAFSQVVGQPRVLLISNDTTNSQALLTALQEAGLSVDSTTSRNMPADTSTLASYRSVVIVNVPSTDFSREQLTQLQTYVRDLGGGLVFVGGEESYGLGGYINTPMEEVLPVDMQIRDEERLPQLTIAYLVDSSGSMENSDDGVFTYLELAQQAIIQSIELLQPDDRAAVGTFSTNGEWLARFQNVDDNRALQSLVASLTPGGGTDILAGLRLVERDIQNEQSPLRHLILLTDGGSSDSGLVEKAQELHDEFGVTLSVIAIGSTAPPFLRQMTEVAEGNFYMVQDVSQLPNIFAQETVLATRSYLVEQDTPPQYSAVSPIMSGISTPPNLLGYVATSPKETAQIILNAGLPYNDPLLAQWQYGLGRSVAFTSDVSRWASNWLNWADFGRFWGQAITWTMTENTNNNLETRFVNNGTQTTVVMDARDNNGDLLNGVSFVGTLLLPDNSTQRLVFQQTSAGEYSATFIPQDEGAYFIAIQGQDPEGITYTQREGWVKGYSAEYNQTITDETLLQDLARLTNGVEIINNPAQVFTPPTNPRIAVVSLAEVLFALAMFLLPFDVAVRRLLVNRSDMERLWAWLRGTRMVEEDERLSALKVAKQRVNVPVVKPQEVNLPTPTPIKTPQPTKPVENKPVSGESSTVGALLKRRKDREESE
jgi:uncharacterized membrane protein